MTLLTTLFEHREADLAADGTILVGAQGTPNLIPNPCAATNVTGWEDLSAAGVERVTSIAGVVIPSGTAIHAPAAASGTYAETDLTSLGGLATGDFLNVQAEVYVGAVATGDVTLQIAVGFIDALGVWNVLYVPGVSTAYVATGAFQRHAVVVEVPAAGHGALTQFTVYATVNEVIAGAADDAELYITQVQVQEGVSGGTVPLYGTSSATMTVANDMAAIGTIAIGGSAWMTVVAHGQDTMAASGRITLGGRARLSGFVVAAIASSSEAAATVITTSAPHGMGTSGTALVTISGHASTPSINGTHTATITGASTFTIPVTVTTAGTGGAANFPDASSGASLPATDGDGWTTPDVTAPDVQGLTVAVSGITIAVAQIEDLTIELDVEGGPKSASMSVNCPLDRAPRVGRDTLVVTYKTQVLFRGRLEHVTGQADSSTGYTLTYAGPLITLRDHKSYRTVFVDSDLASWRVDQGPQTSPDTFEGITAGV